MENRYHTKQSRPWQWLLRMVVLVCLLLAPSFLTLVEAQVAGVVVDSRTRKPLDYVNVYYEGTGVGELTDENGRFALREEAGWNELSVSAMGYVTQTIKLTPGKKKNLRIKLVPEPRQLNEVQVTAKRTKYSRKNNPAVELMQKVIAAKKNNDLHNKDFFSYSTYEKTTLSINEFTDKIFDVEEGRRWAFLKDHVEYCKETGKLILPLTVDELLSTTYFRKEPRTEKTLVKGKNSRGINDFINTGDILNVALRDVFTDVNIYDEECRLLRFHFKSPIANSAINFYRYYIQDTLKVEKDSVIDVGFVPNNMQDIGFSGHLYIMKDSSYQVRRVELNIPSRSDVNFVDNMVIWQDLEELDTGERVAVVNDMLVEMSVVSWLSKVQVRRVVRNFDYAFASIPKSVFKHIKGNVYYEPDAAMHTDNAYWNEYRKVELTETEKGMESFLDRLTHIRGFKYFMIGAKALLENFVETSDSTHNNKFDIGPINTIMSYNHYDHLRLRLSGLTTANLNPHWFWNGYVAYGLGSKNIYGRTELIYSFNRKAYLNREFPKNNIHVSYLNDITSPFDKFVPTDKDNVFTALKTSKVDQYNHTKELKVMYDREWYDGMELTMQFARTSNEAVDRMFYQPLGTDANVPTQGMRALTYNPDAYIHKLRTTEFKLGLSFEPGAQYINTKQRRVKINKDAPIVSISHTMGVKGLFGGDYDYNVTELELYKRLYVPGGWGHISTDLKGGIQWNKVPFPLLIMPPANQSYVHMNNTFSLISSLEFLNDRYLQLMMQWDLCGKIFNRIPLLQKLKWRELIGVNLLWGSLSKKNNPATSNYQDPDLFYFPGHFVDDGKGGTYYENNTVMMEKSRPYVELRLGIHNILRFLHVEYVRRITYRDIPGVLKEGVRLMFQVNF